jgi:hypothetical protein
MWFIGQVHLNIIFGYKTYTNLKLCLFFFLLLLCDLWDLSDLYILLLKH